VWTSASEEYPLVHKMSALDKTLLLIADDFYGRSLTVYLIAVNFSTSCSHLH